MVGEQENQRLERRTERNDQEQKETIKIEGMANGDKLVPYEKSRFLYPI